MRKSAKPTRRARGYMAHEALAGATIAAVGVPLGIGYAEIAGLPPATGLYAALLPVVAYALLGGAARRIVVGPDAGLAALLGATVLPLAEGDPDRAVELALLTALVAGAALLVVRLFRGGVVAELVSLPVLTGYLTAVGLTVLAGQLGALLGIPVDTDSFFEELRSLLESLADANPASAAVGCGALVAMLALRQRLPRLPGALLVAVAGGVVVWALDLDEHGVALVGDVPPGLPALSLPSFDGADLVAVFPGALAIALLAFVDTALMGRAFGARTDEAPDTNRDALGLGVAQAAAAVSGGLPVSASAARSALAAAAGVQSRWAALFSVAAMCIVLVALTDVVSHLPLPVVAAILIAVVIPLVDVRAFRRIWQGRRSEFLVALAAVAGALIAGLLWGVLFAVALSLLDALRRAAVPPDAVVGRVEGRRDWPDVRAARDAASPPGVLVYRFDGALFFANAERFQRGVTALALRGGRRPTWFVLDASGIVDVDYTAAQMLQRLAASLGEQGVRLVVADLTEPARERLRASGVEDALDRGSIFPTVDDAVDAFVRSSRVEGSAPRGGT
ncbi:MAG TPA: SulP family inorganic anion transporter [Gaiellaceae bacterium]|nr:SulP family inorganic anion transporter [Gaiellaceae bacterium]